MVHVHRLIVLYLPRTRRGEHGGASRCGVSARASPAVISLGPLGKVLLVVAIGRPFRPPADRLTPVLVEQRLLITLSLHSGDQWSGRVSIVNTVAAPARMFYP